MSHNGYHFSFISHYCGVSDYLVETKTAQFRLHVDEKCHVWRTCRDEIPPKMLEAFNEWREQEHDRAVEYLASRGYEPPEPFILATVDY